MNSAAIELTDQITSAINTERARPQREERRHHYPPMPGPFMAQLYRNNSTVGGDAPASIKSNQASAALPANDRDYWAQESNQNLKNVLTQLMNLIAYNDYDDDFIRPTDAIINRLWDLLHKTNALLTPPLSLPIGDVFPDGSGGLRVEWVSAKGCVRLVLPSFPASRSYIYFETEAIYKASYEISPATLSDKLKMVIINGQ